MGKNVELTHDSLLQRTAWQHQTSSLQSQLSILSTEPQKNSPNIEEAYLKMHLCFGLYESRSDSDIEIL